MTGMCPIRLACALVLVLGATLAGCADSGAPQATPSSNFSNIPYASWTNDEPQYRLYPGDEVDVVVPSAPELNKTVTVQPDGRVTLPLIAPQMAAAFARQLGADRVVIHSAGSAPGETLNPAVVAAMDEVGIDISAESPKKLTDQMARDADVIVTMGCGDECPFYPGKRYDDWELTDPAGQPIDVVRGVRDDIRRRVSELLAELGALEH